MMQTLTNDSITISSGDYVAKIAVKLNMILHSLTYKGKELLGQRSGLESYASKGSSMGVPLLYPWANRVEADRNYEIADKKFIIYSSQEYKRDEYNSAIHGLLTASPNWTLKAQNSDSISAEYLYSQSHKGFSLYPFASKVNLTYRLDKYTGLTVETRIEALEPQKVAFGWHPYLNGKLLFEPVGRKIPLNMRQLPNRITDINVDEQYRLYRVPIYWLAKVKNENLSVSLSANQGYPYVLVWQPENEEWVCVEPMTANINPWVQEDTISLEAGESHSATFNICVTSE